MVTSIWTPGSMEILVCRVAIGSGKVVSEVVQLIEHRMAKERGAKKWRGGSKGRTICVTISEEV